MRIYLIKICLCFSGRKAKYIISEKKCYCLYNIEESLSQNTMLKALI